MIWRLMIPWINGTMAFLAADDLSRFANGDQFHGTLVVVQSGSQVIWKRPSCLTSKNLITSQMRGLRNFKQSVILGAMCICALSGVTYADSLTLADDTRLTGTVRSIHENGVVELASVLSPDLIELKAGGVTKMEFETPRSPINLPSAFVELTNGDQLPVEVEGLDDENLKVVTADAGPFSIPRTALKSMQLGSRKRKIIYKGPRGLDEWSRVAQGGKNWTFANQTLIAKGRASVSKNFELPIQFVFQLKLKWQATPSFQIYFADPLKSDEAAQDRYLLQFNGSGLEIQRESSQGKRFQTVISTSRTPDQFPKNEVKIEVRVDRKTSRLYLFLDGEPEGTGVDPLPDSPLGNGIGIVSSSAITTSQEISDIEISEVDHPGTRHRSENRGDPKADSMTSRDDDRWSGRLTGVKKGGEGNVFAFKGDFQNEPLELAESDVSMIFFAQEESSKLPMIEHPLALRLRGDGLLTVTSCVFSEASVVAHHPLLGMIKVERAGIASLQWINSESQPKSKTKPEANAEE